MSYLFGSSLNHVDILPAPSSIEWDKGLPLSLASTLEVSGDVSSLLIEALDRTMGQIARAPAAVIEYSGSSFTNYFANNSCASITGVTFDIGDLTADLQFNVDESYELEITVDGEFIITAPTPWGALHALTSFEQLVIEDPYGNLQVEHAVTIVDKPQYPHRGLHLDTARNYYTISFLETLIDSMALAKMNVLHWHVTDTQSWPIEVKTYPQMIQDAYSRKQVYTAEHVKHLVRYAKARGVRIVPEVDMPGHSAAGWKRIDPDIVVGYSEPWTEVAVEPPGGQLNIALSKTFDVVTNVYNDISDLFTDDFFHVGFDEVQTSCYNFSSDIRQWLKANSSRTYTDLAQMWVDKTYPIFVKDGSKRLIMWQEAVTSTAFAPRDIPKDIILQVWEGGPEVVANLTKLGHDVIISESDFLYLDCGFGGWVTNDDRYDVQSNPDPSVPNFNYGGSGGSWCAPYKTYQRMYDYDFTANLTSEQKSHIIGAAAALWSEQSDSQNAESVIWPRTAALAELLWSGHGDKSAFTGRILNFREKLVDRGVRASPLVPQWCVSHPGRCDLNV